MPFDLDQPQLKRHFTQEELRQREMAKQHQNSQTKNDRGKKFAKQTLTNFLNALAMVPIILCSIIIFILLITNLPTNLNSTTIPDSVYQNTTRGDKLFNVINGSRKTIYFTRLAGCPYSKAFNDFVNSSLRKTQTSGFYNQYIFKTTGRFAIRCANRTIKCADAWIHLACSGKGKICFILPGSRQMIAVPMDNKEAIVEAMETYARS